MSASTLLEHDNHKPESNLYITVFICNRTVHLLPSKVLEESSALANRIHPKIPRCGSSEGFLLLLMLFSFLEHSLFHVFQCVVVFLFSIAWACKYQDRTLVPTCACLEKSSINGCATHRCDSMSMVRQGVTDFLLQWSRSGVSSDIISSCDTFV